MRWLAYGLLACAAEAAVDKIIRPPTQPTGNGSKLLTFQEATTGKLAARSSTFAWIAAEGREGYYVTTANGSLVERNIVTQDQRTLVPAEQVPADYYEFWFNADATQILWAIDYTKQYRHSYFANYLVQDVASGEVSPLIPEQDGDIQYAVWSPSATDNTIAFVRGNNVYIWRNGTTTQITNDGGPDLFNGVPDWVYEEEIFGTNFVLWFNAAGDQQCYLTTNETGVPTFTVQYWMNHTEPSGSVALSYPDELDLRYPKVGATNPTIAANLLNLNWGAEGPAPKTLPVSGFDASDLIIGEVAWLDSQIAIRIFNRVQSMSKLFLYDTATEASQVTREQDGSDGWLDNHLAISYIGDGQFVDQNDLSGYDHFYLYSVNDTASPVALTKGDFEVRSLLYVDQARRIAYYTSTEVHPTESHVFGVSLDTAESFNLTDTSQPGFWSASFTQEGNYYVLSYTGPNVPLQQLYAVNDTATPIRTITDNAALIGNLSDYKLPVIEYLDLESPSGFTFSGMLRYPANFDASKKYPILFIPYGGPGAQEVTKRMSAFNFKSYVAADPELEYITFTLDGRGTGFRGRAHRASVNRHLGEFEAEDQIWAAQELSRRYNFIDTDKIQIWGWSFGGYLTAKVVEADSGVFSQGLSTAPVSDWRLYDSMYTERYMGLPDSNFEGYNGTAVRKVDGFKNIAGGVLIQHGTGDDNVHFQNSEVLVDVLVGGGVGPDKLEVAYFTDSDHSIVYNGANTYVYQQLAERLFTEKIREVGPSLSHQWTATSEQPLAKSKRDIKMEKRDQAKREAADSRLERFRRSLEV